MSIPVNICGKCGTPYFGSLGGIPCPACKADIEEQMACADGENSETSFEETVEKVVQFLKSKKTRISRRRRSWFTTDSGEPEGLDWQPRMEALDPQTAFYNMRLFQFAGLNFDSIVADVEAMGGVYSAEQSHPEIHHEVFEREATEDQPFGLTTHFLTARNYDSLILGRLMSLWIIAPRGIIVRSDRQSLLDALLEEYGEPEITENSQQDSTVYKWTTMDLANTPLIFDPETQQNVRRISQPGQSYSAFYRRLHKVGAEVIEFTDDFLANVYLNLMADEPKQV